MAIIRVNEVRTIREEVMFVSLDDIPSDVDTIRVVFERKDGPSKTVKLDADMFRDMYDQRNPLL